MKHTTINNVFVDGRAVSVRAVAGRWLRAGHGCGWSGRISGARVGAVGYKVTTLARRGLGCLPLPPTLAGPYVVRRQPAPPCCQLQASPWLECATLAQGTPSPGAVGHSSSPASVPAELQPRHALGRRSNHGLHSLHRFFAFHSSHAAHVHPHPARLARCTQCVWWAPGVPPGALAIPSSWCPGWVAEAAEE